MFAVIQLGGKQYLAKENQALRIEKLQEEAGKTLSCRDVLLVANESETKIGAPYVAGASVDLKILEHGRGCKIRIFKMKAKKRYKRLRGHRQPFTDVEVLKIKT